MWLALWLRFTLYYYYVEKFNVYRMPNTATSRYAGSNTKHERTNSTFEEIGLVVSFIIYILIQTTVVTTSYYATTYYLYYYC